MYRACEKRRSEKQAGLVEDGIPVKEGVERDDREGPVKEKLKASKGRVPVGHLE